MNIDFKDQVVLVTGATRGIGKQLADDFARLGAKLILTGTSEEQVRDLNELTDSRRKYYSVDFTDRHSTENFRQELKQYEKIDVCVNNAGINRINYIDKTRLQDWDDIISVNLKAPFVIIREVSKIMKKNGYGRIINISSIFGVVSREKRSIYTTSKFGLSGLTVASSIDLSQYGVLVNAVSPGFVLTDLTKSILTEEEIKKLTEQIPARRFATPDEISHVIIFLASSFNTYVTGQNIVVDGGYVNV
jgi:3-oxoacyl-[acyl-carrier protein] reductase